MQRPPIFTLEAANSLVPRLKTLVGAQLSRRSLIETQLKELRGIIGNVPDELSVRDDDPAPVRSLKLELLKKVDEYQRGWQEVEELGAVLKDPKIGLLDFYGRVDGKLVWLCWKYGENEVAHYHGLDEGYAARKAIGQGIRQRLLN